MRNCFSIIHYEYKMQIKRISAWGILIATVVFAMMDNFPSAGNLARLEFLSIPSYFVYRTMSQNTLILVFGLIFLLSSRIPYDFNTGMIGLMMAYPVTKRQYVFGKLFGSFLFTLTMVTVFLTLNTLIYFIAAPFRISAPDCLIPLVKTLVVSGLPVCFFISFASAALPAVMDVRLFYLLTSVLFIINAFTVSSAEAMPFYLITSGDLIKLIWQHPAFPLSDCNSVHANLFFLMGSGSAACMSLFLKRSFWRLSS
jgi:hypothetical protein